MIGSIRELSGEMETFWVLIWMMVTGADTFTETHQSVQLIVAYFSMSKLHPNNIPQKQTNKWINVDFRAFAHALPGVPFAWGIPAPFPIFSRLAPPYHSSLSLTITCSTELSHSLLHGPVFLFVCFHLANYALKLSCVMYLFILCLFLQPHIDCKLLKEKGLIQPQSWLFGGHQCTFSPLISGWVLANGKS